MAEPAKASEPWRCEHGVDTRTCEACAVEDEAFADEHAKASEVRETTQAKDGA